MYSAKNELTVTKAKVSNSKWKTNVTPSGKIATVIIAYIQIYCKTFKSGKNKGKQNQQTNSHITTHTYKEVNA